MNKLPTRRQTMKVLMMTFALSIVSWMARAQTATVLKTGNWDNASIWESSNIGDAITKDVAFIKSTNNVVATVRNGYTYTVGSVDLGNTGDIVVQSTGVLNIGEPGTPKNLIANNNATLQIAGALNVYGDVIVENNLTLQVSGTMVVKGNVEMKENASLLVSGTLQIDGDMTAIGNNTLVTNIGDITVGGMVTVGGGTTALTNFGNFAAGGCQGNPVFCETVILPVRMLYFSASTENGDVALSWATGTETNFDKFIIEKTFDAENFFEIGRLDGAGTSVTHKNYSFKDPNPAIGKAYYRLKTVDFDGYHEYFGMVMVEVAGQKDVSVYPNPTSSDRVGVQLNFDPKDNTHVVLLDVYGLEISKQQATEQFQQFDFGNLKPGAYILRVVSEGVLSQSKIILQ